MKTNTVYRLFFWLIFTIPILAADTKTTPSSGGDIDWVQTIFAGSYLVGVFILLPLVVYTNIKEGLSHDEDGVESSSVPISDISEEERNSRAIEILGRMDKKLTPFKSEEGKELLTITKGSQAKFVKYGLDYINNKLKPTDAEIIARVKEVEEVYEDRAQRAFTGSNWIIGCSIGVGVLVLLTAGISTFIFIHILGLIFYVLSSRTTMYGIEKRLKYFGSGGGMLGRILSGLFLGGGSKYYVKHGGGPWKRDYETEGQMAIFGLIIMLFVALILGFFATFLGVINFVINYSTSFLNPLQNEEKWYQSNFVSQPS